MTIKPREFWIRPEEPFGGEHICPHPIPINEGYNFFQQEAVHVVEYSALVAAQAEIERLTNQYNEQLDLARHRAVELDEMASIANNAHRIIAELQTELEQAKAELIKQAKNYGVFNKDIHDKLKFLREELEHVNRKAMDHQNAESYARKLWHEETTKIKAELERANTTIDILKKANSEFIVENKTLTLMAESVIQLLRNYFEFQDEHSRAEWEKEARAALKEGEER